MRIVRAVGALLLPLAIGSCQVFLAGEPPAIDLHTYEVEGDGTHDDTRGLQQAILDAEARGVPLVIPAPRAFYLIGQTLVVNNARLIGSGGEIVYANGTVLRVDGAAHISNLKFTGRNGIEVHGGVFEDITVEAGYPDETSGNGWAINAPTSTIPGGVTIRRSVLHSVDAGYTFALGLLESAEVTLEDVAIVGTRWGVLVRGPSTLTASNTYIFGSVAGLELDRKPRGYPLGLFGDSDILLRDCRITTDPAGPRWDLAVPFVAGVGHVILEGTTNPTNILNNYSGPAGSPPVGPPIGSVDDVIVRR